MEENIFEMKEGLHLEIQSSKASLYASKKVTSTIIINITTTISVTILWQQDSAKVALQCPQNARKEMSART